MREISVGAIIFHNKEVLLIHQKHGNHIGFPKGHIENNESFEETALREVFEEVGVNITLLQISYEVFYEPRPNVNKKVIYYLACSKSVETSIQPSEILRAFWVSPEEAFKHLTYDNDKQALKYMIAQNVEDVHDYRNC